VRSIGTQLAAVSVSTNVASLMYSLDTTIANIALAHIHASVSASQDQISWVPTSYLVASAIMTPATGFPRGWFDLKQIYLFSVAGFGRLVLQRLSDTFLF
jgi:MFS transporter, DHA2 family, multidrug resistance protein